MAINVDAAIAKYKNPVDFDGMYGAQCVDLVAFICRDNGLPVMYADAAYWFINFNQPGAYDKIANNPSDANQLPQKGDIIIWNTNLPNSGGAGHIAVVVSTFPGGFVSFDQNWGGAYPHLVTHNWSYVLGWLHPKDAAPQPQGGDEMIANEDQARDAYALLRGSRDALSQDELNATAGHRTWSSFAVDARGEIAAREANKRAMADQIANLNVTINQLNQAVTEALTQTNATKADKDAALAKVADLTSQLETAHDKLVDLQKKSSALEAEKKKDTATGNSFLRWLGEQLNKLAVKR